MVYLLWFSFDEEDTGFLHGVYGTEEGANTAETDLKKLLIDATFWVQPQQVQ